MTQVIGSEWLIIPGDNNQSSDVHVELDNSEADH